MSAQSSPKSAAWNFQGAAVFRAFPGLFPPAFAYQHIVSTIAVHVADAQAVRKRLRAG
jgi:hypothetical protein